jgi:hypothetical protein
LWFRKYFRGKIYGVFDSKYCSKNVSYHWFSRKLTIFFSENWRKSLKIVNIIT